MKYWSTHFTGKTDFEQLVRGRVSGA